MTEYERFVATKLTRVPPTGIDVVPPLHPSLFQFQVDIVAWALRRGRAAVFADTGLGKTAMQLEWARHVPGDVLILAPLAVTSQTAREGSRLGMDVTVCRDGTDVKPGINVTNYDRLHRFNPSQFTGVVLDESSIIKHHDAKTLDHLLEAFAATPFRLCATATPSPNDYTELGTHAEFLGICSRAEMLAEYFCHDGGETQVWRLKKHGRANFWAWVAGWGAMLRKPSDLGYPDEGYDLPALNIHQHTLAADQQTVRNAGLLFAAEAGSMTERRAARRASLDARVRECAARANDDRQPWIVWCDLNAESEALAGAIDGAIEVRGSDTVEEKEARLCAFAEGRARVLVSKPSICGFGLNWQHCARVAFVGVTDSYEAFYQAVRRCWRFGQTRAVDVHVYASEIEGSVIRNLKRKELDAQVMAERLAVETRAAVRAAVRGQQRQTNNYAPREIMTVPDWINSEQGAS